MLRLSVAFFCSGFSALLCQVVWQRMLGIFAGSDTVSAALVVGAFLAGLGIGSILGAKIADRLTPARALAGFALAEAGVAVFALVSKFVLYDVMAIRLAGVVDAPAVIFVLCFLAVVLPTTLMGASLPLLARAVATSLDTVAERIGRLYGLNTAGAGLGALAGGWIIAGTLGFVGTLVLAAVLDILAALLALTLLPALRRAPVPVAAAAAGPAAAAGEPFGSLRGWCVLVFLSGYVIVALEILWVRLLGQVGQYHAYLFPTVLGVFLLADGAGMAFGAWLLRRIRDPRPAFFLTQAGGFVLAAALIMALWLALPHWPLNRLVPVDYPRTFGRPLVSTVILTVLVVGPPSFLIGMTFPFVQRAVQQDLASVGARVGWVQLANILGNAAGSIGTGLVTFHLIGTAGTLKLLAAVSVLLMLFWLWRGGWRRPAELALAGACALALLLTPGNEGFWRRIHAWQPGTFAPWAEDRSGVAFYRDDHQVAEEMPGRFFIAGFSQGNIPFRPLHVVLGAVGPMIHPDPKRVLVIGVGSGGTPYGALVSPRTEHVRAVEIVGPVLDVLRQVAAARDDGVVAGMLRDPRLVLEYGDGRRALAQGEELYDVIEADAVLPQSSHSGLLYSREFLEQVRRRLAPGGVYVQWSPSYTVAQTFVASFPHALWLRPSNILIGSNDPIAADAASIAARLTEPATLAYLTRGGPEVTEAWLAGIGRDRSFAWRPGDPRPAAALTDLFPRDEFFVNNRVVYPGEPTERGPALVAR